MNCEKVVRAKTKCSGPEKHLQVHQNHPRTTTSWGWWWLVVLGVVLVVLEVVVEGKVPCYTLCFPLKYRVLLNCF